MTDNNETGHPNYCASLRDRSCDCDLSLPRRQKIDRVEMHTARCGRFDQPPRACDCDEEQDHTGLEARISGVETVDHPAHYAASDSCDEIRRGGLVRYSDREERAKVKFMTARLEHLVMTLNMRINDDKHPIGVDPVQHLCMCATEIARHCAAADAHRIASERGGE